MPVAVPEPSVPDYEVTCMFTLSCGRVMNPAHERKAGVAKGIDSGALCGNHENRASSPNVREKRLWEVPQLRGNKIRRCQIRIMSYLVDEKPSKYWVVPAGTESSSFTVETQIVN